jgi:hypothetical protein
MPLRGKMPENTGRKQAHGRFHKGKSGNPKGRPTGTKNKITLMAELLLKAEVKEICFKVAEEAKQGNMQAIKIVLDRLLPPRKDNPIHLELPKIEKNEDLLKAICCITQAVGNGDISPSEGEALARIVDIHAKAVELAEFEKRLAALEENKK